MQKNTQLAHSSTQLSPPSGPSKVFSIVSPQTYRAKLVSICNPNAVSKFPPHDGMLALTRSRNVLKLKRIPDDKIIKLKLISDDSPCSCERTKESIFTLSNNASKKLSRASSSTFPTNIASIVRV